MTLHFSYATILLFILPIALADNISTNENTRLTAERECTLECPTDAPCTFGETPFANQNELEVGGMHCACPPGWTGIFCDHKYESCGDSHDCYHGGKCLDNGLLDSFGNPQLVCDCSNAQTSDGLRYVGKYCETPFEKSCSNENDELFCVNGGDCNPNYANDGIACLCEEGWKGFHCEFKEDEVPDCDLDCDNGGVCVVGIRSSAETDLLRRVWSDEEIIDHMRCLCPVGYGGPRCQSISEECGDDHCYHGGTCVTTTTTIHGESTVHFHCDCTTATDSKGSRFAGGYCQEVSTVFCDVNDGNLFCTNRGTCATTPTDPCICPDGFAGHKCEYDTRPPNNPKTGSEDQDVDPTPSEPCGDIFCLNGSECISREFTLEDGTQGQEDVCDCTTAHRPNHYLAFAGDACQYKSTSVCSSSVDAEIKFCVNGGLCQSDTDSCSCPKGWTGEHCEVHTKDHKSDQDPTCGDTVCYNGGKCLETTIFVENEDGTASSSVLQYCDCADAFDDDHLYAGLSCEYKSTALCTEPEIEGDTLGGLFFCANHGTCRKNIQEGCTCPDGFSGLHCEFLNLDEDPDGSSGSIAFEESTEECGDDLVCKNGGTCTTTLVKDVEGGIRHIQMCDCSTTATQDTVFAGLECEHEATEFCTEPDEGAGLETAVFCVQGGKCGSNVLQGCDCHAGWTGLRCEFTEEVDDILDQDGSDGAIGCGGMYCYNGGVCQVSQTVNEDTGELEDVFSCDCTTTATATEIYGGLTCSYKSTSVCQRPADDAEETLKGALVCLNHGTCREDPREGCDCPSGFTGTICEFEVDGGHLADVGEACGDGYCYNGGKCVKTTITNADEEITVEYRCDCSSAFDEDFLYAGDSCQHKSTTQCTHPKDDDDSLLGTLFCVNGGTCNEDVQQGCDCPHGWTGFFCEFAEDPQDVDSNDDLGVYDQCGEYLCLNGGSCTSTQITLANGTKTSIQYCDCNMAFDENNIYAGPNCEYQATAICSEPRSSATDLRGVQFCVNGGKCNKEDTLSGCECPSHWTGLRCELEADGYEEDDSSVQCGDFACLNGGHCIVSVTDDVEEHSCDCSTAFNDFYLYDGPFCQYQSTQLCDKPNEGSVSKVGFCVNNGICQEDGGCRCPSGYYGARCEMTIYIGEDPEDASFSQDDDDDYEYSCVLACANGGHCVKGAKDHGSLGDVVDSVAHLNSTYHETFFEHCLCPDGFVGLTCEHKVEVCGENEHYCLHGSTCAKRNGKHTCDCSRADENIGHGDQPSVFGGNSCEHPANDICIKGAVFPTRPLYFCVHGGVCRGYVTEGEDDPGCDCPDGWTGPHCETRIQAQSSQLSAAQGSEDMLLISLVTAVLIFLLLVLVTYFVRSSYLSDKNSSQDCMIFRRRWKRHALSEDPTSRSSNLAPRRFTNKLDPRAVVSPSSDPIAAGVVLPPDDEPVLYHDGPKQAYRDARVSGFRDEPNIIDEEEDMASVVSDDDGHVLHNFKVV